MGNHVWNFKIQNAWRKNLFSFLWLNCRFAFETLKRLQEDGHRLILWTYRSGLRLEEAVKFCNDYGIQFYAVNKSFPEEQFDYTKSWKIYADLFIDDRNIGGVLGWGEVYQMITNETPNIKKNASKKGLFSFLKK